MVERVTAVVVSPLRAFPHAESAAGVLLTPAAAALVLANSPVGAARAPAP